MEMIIGFKAFNKGLINRYGMKYEINKLYHTEGLVKYGINGKGYHMCLNLEDTLRFYNSFNNDIDICLVAGIGNYEEHNDEYYGYYNLYCFQNIVLIKKLKREEIIEYAKRINIERLKRFVSLFKLTEEEIDYFYNIDEVLNKYIDYYQKNDKKVFKLKKYLK